jgi:hypothetical protein
VLPTSRSSSQPSVQNIALHSWCRCVMAVVVDGDPRRPSCVTKYQ